MAGRVRQGRGLYGTAGGGRARYDRAGPQSMAAAQAMAGSQYGTAGQGNAGCRTERMGFSETLEWPTRVEFLPLCTFSLFLC